MQVEEEKALDQMRILNLVEECMVVVQVEPMIVQVSVLDLGLVEEVVVNTLNFFSKYVLIIRTYSSSISN